MKQKKYYKTFKFWITSLLALSASSIIASLALTSCVANDSANKSDIVINDQTQDQEVSVDDTQSVTLTVEATSNKGEDLSYQWYVNKNTSNSTWTKIDGATNKTYTIPASDLQSANGETTWQYKAEIYHNNDLTKKVESKPISVKIKPPTGGGSVPDKPNLPEEKPEPTPPIEPPTPDDNPSQPIPPSPTPPGSNPSDQPGIVPSPPYTPSQGIGARLPLDKRGVVTTKYDQEKWIGDNSISMAIMAKPNIGNITKAINDFNRGPIDASVKRMLNDLVGAMNNYSYNQFGTGWILDYSDNTNGNLKDYYIATNMHVINSYFEIVYDSNRYNNNNSESLIKVGVRIPFNKHTISNLDVYISQPKYNLTDQKLNSKSYADQLNTQWYKTDVSIDSWADNLIPIGAYNADKGNGFEYSTPFDMELTWQDSENINLKETLYFQSNNNGQYLTSPPVTSNYSFQNDVDDFSVFKISLANTAFDELIKKGDQYSVMFKKMKELFDTSNDDNVNKNSSYIKKLNKLLKITTKGQKYTNKEVDDLFMFGDYKQITNPETQISIGGYPLIQEAVKGEGDKYKWEAYTTFNTNTLTGNNIIDYPPSYYHTRDKMGINQYVYKGNTYKIKWKGPNNYILKNINLLAGSSGGVAIDKDYKISCINWGSFIHIEYYQGIKYVLDSSSSTGLYSKTDKSSLIWKWVTYAQKNNKQTKLAKLFSQLENNDYFK